MNGNEKRKRAEARRKACVEAAEGLSTYPPTEAVAALSFTHGTVPKIRRYAKRAVSRPYFGLEMHREAA